MKRLVQVPVIAAILLSATVSEGSWNKGLRTKPFKEGVDRIFIVDESWREGRLTGLDEEAVAFMEGKVEKSYPRSEISLIELGDWLDPAKRKDKNELRVRIKLKGDAETGVIFFSGGTIIKEVHAEPTFTDGQDDDDKASTTRTSIRFEKGNKDRSITTLTADITLLLGNPDVLTCEVHCRRANGRAGTFDIQFMQEKGDKPLVVLKHKIQELWTTFSVPVNKLKSGRTTFRVDALSWNSVKARTIKSLAPSLVANPKRYNKVRVFLINDKLYEGTLVGIDDDFVRLQTKPMGDPTPIPRSLVSTLQLYDWEEPWRRAGIKSKPNEGVTPPIRIVFSGTSSSGMITFNDGTSLAKLIMPPHFVNGRDHQDFGIIKTEREIGYEKVCLDRSTSQIEAIVVLSFGEGPAVVGSVANKYTNILAGDMSLEFFNALTGKRMWASGKRERRAQTWGLSIKNSRLMK